MTTIAIMQPYFAPYAGYFRLFQMADVFIIYDCVQFPRRGWVHRNRFTTPGGAFDWLTLPVLKCDQSTKIKDLMFREEASDALRENAAKFPLLAQGTPFDVHLYQCRGEVSTYLENLLHLCCKILELPWRVNRSSELGLSDHLKGQDRILKICERFGATRYINASGGVDLYEENKFTSRGIELDFLTPYRGPMGSLIERLLTENHKEIRDDICRQTTTLRGQARELPQERLLA